MTPRSFLGTAMAIPLPKYDPLKPFLCGDWWKNKWEIEQGKQECSDVL